MEDQTVNILGLPFINISKNGFIRKLVKDIERNQKVFIVTANPEIVMLTHAKADYRESIQSATYIIADGIGVIKGSEILGNKLVERIPGVEVFEELLEHANEQRKRVYFYGAKPEVLEKLLKNVELKYPNTEVCGSKNGYVQDKDRVADEIRTLSPDLVFVALGAPKQEEWISQNFSHFHKGVFMGVGGSFDWLAGEAKRAPKIVQKANLEWLYRIVKNPTRVKRFMQNLIFFKEIYKEKRKRT